MAHILKLEEWESNGKWLCGDVSALAAGSNTWWYIPNLLSLAPVDYVKLLISKFHAIDIHYSFEKDVLIYYFATQADVRKFKNHINKLARERNFSIY